LSAKRATPLVVAVKGWDWGGQEGEAKVQAENEGKEALLGRLFSALTKEPEAMDDHFLDVQIIRETNTLMTSRKGALFTTSD
jgi:hypothetical protein